MHIHWFWRFLFAITPSALYAMWQHGRQASPLEAWVIGELYKFLGGTYRPLLDWQQRVAHGTVYGLPKVVAAVCIYALLTHYFGPPHASDGETRCRKCRYILRGLSELRCPECGERI